MANNEFAGSALYATWVYTTGTVVLSTDCRSFVYTPSLSFIDATAGADTATRRLAYMKDGQVTCSIVMQSDMGTADINALAEGTSGSVIWGEAGTASGKPKVTLPALSMGMTRRAPYNDVVTYDITFQQNGARTDGQY